MTTAWLTTATTWARHIKLDILALWIAARDHRTPFWAKVTAAAVAAYALSPIDLIPDFVPVLGYLDDLLIVPLGIMLAVSLIPAPLMEEFRCVAKAQADRPRSRLGLAFVITIWIFGAAAIVWSALGWFDA